MFTVSVLYSTKDFLSHVATNRLSPERFKDAFSSFRYSNPSTVLELSFLCGWTMLDIWGKIHLTERGQSIANSEYSDALLFQLEDMIFNYNPEWASLLPKGRDEAKHFLPKNVYQCFNDAGLFKGNDDLTVKAWDRLALAYRNYHQQKLVEIGRDGERLSITFEEERTGRLPIWQSIESNLAGYDLLSIKDLENDQLLRIEVKASINSVDYASFFLSKNEWETASLSENYVFHLWCLKKDPVLFIVSKSAVLPHIPENKGSGNWQNVRVPFSAVIEKKKGVIFNKV